jgi:oligopeptide transport system substrate-binding protein
MWPSIAYFEDGDIARARQELEVGLKELNIKKEDLPVIKLSYNTNNGHHKIAQAIQAQWRHALGIEVSLESMEWKVFLDSVRTHSFQVARMGGVASFRDPDHIPFCLSA